MELKGWVYVITNRAMPDLVKVGYSMKDPRLRAEELGHTGTPHRYEVRYEVLVAEPRAVEQSVHKALAASREGKEWFRCSVEMAVRAIREQVGSRAITESFTDVDRRALQEIAEREAEANAARETADQARYEARSKLMIERQRIVSYYERELEEKGRVVGFPVLYLVVAAALCGAAGLLLPARALWIALPVALVLGAAVTALLRDRMREVALSGKVYRFALERRDEELRRIDAKLAEADSRHSATLQEIERKSVEAREHGQAGSKNVGASQEPRHPTRGETSKPRVVPDTGRKPSVSGLGPGRLEGRRTLDTVCKQCGESFRVTVTPYDTGVACPACYRFEPFAPG